ncbi:MAG: flagellar filament capping protein FliD [Lachnospiraceae bacterium]|nr:flagellar filament capping protein FliD [Lachnospiraceae bacterium]MDE6743891.1 flagellar filament capping protein FliD [Lachnospiraceae bacterium]
MRVTNQMLNESARRAGTPVNGHSLLDYVNGGNSNNMISEKLMANKRLSKTEKTKYEKQEKAAEELDTIAQKLSASGKDSIWEKVKESGDTTEITKKAQELVEKYNKLLESMKDTSGALNEFYRRSLKELPDQHKEALAEIGITTKKDGSLEIDQEKLKGASLEQLEKVFGKDSKLTTRISYVSSRIADNASANLENLSGSYLPDGNTTSSHLNKYDFWG